MFVSQVWGALAPTIMKKHMFLCCCGMMPRFCQELASSRATEEELICEGTSHIQCIHRLRFREKELEANNEHLQHVAECHSQCADRLLSCNVRLRNVAESQHQEAAQLQKAAAQLQEATAQELEQVRTCAICCSRPRDVLFMPCGHFASCATCAVQVASCPYCRANIVGRQQVHTP